MDITRWLGGLGLEQYQHAFSEGDVDAAVLPHLTADDLIALGVTSIGHRRKLLAAIAALRPATQSAPDIAVAGTMRVSSSRTAIAGAERRQLTVMFCDLVGSTALSSRLDPEDLREVISAYQSCVAGVISRHHGFVAKYMGDGVLVYFGYPRAHEDDAERAVRAALSIIDAVGRLDVQLTKLQARVGIATGLVVVGDLIGEGSAQEQSVVGETPNLAARLQALAEPDAVVIAAGTRRLVGDLFEYRDLGAVEVKGIAGPVRAWQVLRPSAVASRFEALRGSALSRLVGRDEEIDLLMRRWARAQTGDGQVVLVSGESGIGKSRITAALEERLHTGRSSGWPILPRPYGKRLCSASIGRLFSEGAVIRSTARVFCASPRSTNRDNRRSSRHWDRSAVRPSSLYRAAADARSKAPWVAPYQLPRQTGAPAQATAHR